jgi:hypothetical protein
MSKSSHGSAALLRSSAYAVLALAALSPALAHA